MAEVEIKASEEKEGKIMPVNTQVIPEGSDVSAAVTCNEREGQENDTTGEGKKQDEIQPKEQELPELIRHKHESKRMMPCLPSINLLELTTILRDPNMPSQKILKEVADKIMTRSEESESDDGSVSSGGGVVGMKGLLDCIFEVSYMHEDSDISDDDDSFERIPRQIPCTFCNKIFGSTMTWNTHVLVAHPQQEHSVHNIRKTSVSESERKEKGHPHRKHLRSSSKSECDASNIKAYYTSAANKKQASGEENVPVRKRHSSFSKSQHREVRKWDSKHQPSSGQLKNESPSSGISSCELMHRDKEIATVEHQSESTEGEVNTGAASEALDKVSAVESAGKSAKASSQQQGTDNTCLNQSSSEMKDDTELPQSSGSASGTHIPVNSSEHAAALSSHSKCGQKRRTTPELPESTSVSSLSSKRSRKTIAKD
ncbi:unnamed protein product [Candidula unifasciata]|uniref:C2H2-type domain-containing protein n=1 Tax=Candidula unifasciata TaxID=100452 RepID=A0A8S3ZSJ4_9EUPU|nr:unnamed protein product [Candidula unifasciata]